MYQGIVDGKERGGNLVWSAEEGEERTPRYARDDGSFFVDKVGGKTEKKAGADLKFGHYTSSRYNDSAGMGRSMLRPYEDGRRQDARVEILRREKRSSG